MIVPRKCSVCGHAERDTIDRALLNPSTSKRGIARRYGLDDAAVERHAARHLPARLARAREAWEQLAADDLLVQARAIQQGAFDVLLDAGREDKDGKLANPELMLKAIPVAREGVRLLAEVLAKLRPAGGTTVVQRYTPNTVGARAEPDPDRPRQRCREQVYTYTAVWTGAR